MARWCSIWSGCGREGDVVSELLELSDEVAGFVVFAVVLVVEVGSEVVVAGVGVVEEVPDDHEDGSGDRDERFAFASSAYKPPVSFPQEGVGSGGTSCSLTEHTFEVAVPLPVLPERVFGPD